MEINLLASLAAWVAIVATLYGLTTLEMEAADRARLETRRHRRLLWLVARVASWAGVAAIIFLSLLP